MKPTFRSRGFALALALLGALATPLARADDPGAPAVDPIADQIFPPELVMRHQKALQLSDAQKATLIAEVKRTQARLIDVQWELQRALEPLVELIGKDKPDETQVLAQLDKVLAAEREFKRTQLTLAVRLKGMLSVDQQRQLRELRASQATPPGAAKPAPPR